MEYALVDSPFTAQRVVDHASVVPVEWRPPSVVGRDAIVARETGLAQFLRRGGLVQHKTVPAEVRRHVTP